MSVSMSVSWNAALSTDEYLTFLLNLSQHRHRHPRQRRSDGGVYRYIYPQKSVYLTNFYVVSLLVVLFTCGTLTCFHFEIGMTS